MRRPTCLLVVYPSGACCVMCVSRRHTEDGREEPRCARVITISRVPLEVMGIYLRGLCSEFRILGNILGTCLQQLSIVPKSVFQATFSEHACGHAFSVRTFIRA